jgi:heptosyltransferase-1
VPESVLVVRLGAMGDIIHTLPAVAALRNAWPATRIGWVVEQRWMELLCARDDPRSGPRSPARPVVDFVHVVDTKRWRKSPFSRDTRRQMAEVRRELKNQQYELAIDFQGAAKSGIVSRFAKTTLGMEHPRETPARWFYDRRITTTGAHVIEQYHSLAEAAAGHSLAAGAATFPDADLPQNSGQNAVGNSGQPFALVNPGAGWGAKQWPADRYGEVAQALANAGLSPLINFGPGEEELADIVKNTSGGTAHPVSCSISELIALTRRARLFIGGDTGPLHLAAALRVPVVAIYGPTDPARNGPYGTKSIVLRDPASRTSLSHTSDPDAGLLQITAEEVIFAAHTLLEETRA